MKETAAELGEFGLIERIRNLLAAAQGPMPSVRLGIGDDCAVFSPPEGHEMLVTCDSLVEGRHYLPALISHYDLGRRAMVQNISDIGAMGGCPIYALVSLGLKSDTLVRLVEEMYRGFLSELLPLGGSIIGGNITSVAAEPFIDITLVGAVSRGMVVSRAGARPGDAILVTGFPGESGAGLSLLRKNRTCGVSFSELGNAYLRPDHRAREGRAVAQTGYATAMIDTSDGLAADLGHICSASGVGARLSAARLPARRRLRDAAAFIGCDPLELVLGESDDYELVITCPAEFSEHVSSVVSDVNGASVSEIGTVTADAGRIILETSRGEKVLRTTGWDHFRTEGVGAQSIDA